MQPKNLKTRNWAARVVTYLLYHKCNAKLMIVYTSLLTTYGTALRKIANIYFYCTVNLQDSAPSNNIIMKEGEIKHQKAQEKIPSSRWDANSDNPLEFSIGCFTTELLERTGSNLIIVHQHERTVSDTCSKSAVHHTWLPMGHFWGASSLHFKARLSAKPLIWKWFFILIQI